MANKIPPVNYGRGSNNGGVAMARDRYKVVVNYQGEIFTEYTYASSKNHALIGYSWTASEMKGDYLRHVIRRIPNQNHLPSRAV